MIHKQFNCKNTMRYVMKNMYRNAWKFTKTFNRGNQQAIDHMSESLYISTQTT